MDCYCVKCKQKTKTSNAKYIVAINSKHMIKGKCDSCNEQKS